MSLARWGGLVGVVAGAAYTATGFLDGQGPLWPLSFSYLAQYALLLALMGTLVAIAGLHAKQRKSYGWVGIAGFVVASFGHLLFLLVTVEQILAGSSVGPGAQQIGSWAILIGLVALGLATLSARVFPSWCAVAIVVGGVLASVSHFMFWWPLLGIVLGIAWALVGYALLSSRDVSG